MKTDDLDPWFRGKVLQAIDYMEKDAELRNLGIKGIIVTEGKRTLLTQVAYYCRGRMKVPDVKAVFEAVGLWKLSDKEAETPNTWTLKSKHLDGLAVDLYPSLDGKNIWYSAPDAVWDRIGLIGESFGLEWGGRWKEKDRPHFQK